MIKLNVIAAGFLCVSATAAFADVPGPLVTTEWLSDNSADVVLLDVRKVTETFMDVGHIPGATLVNYGQINGTLDVDGVTLKQMRPEASDFSALMQASGVNSDSTIVITFGGDTTDQVTQATRLYWVLKYFGHEDVAILDGGTAQWVANENALSDDFSDEVVGNYVAGAPHDELLATTEQVAEASANGTAGIFDARGLDQFIGLRYKQGFVLEAGHIPGASLATGSIFQANSGPKVFESSAKIIAGLAALGAEGDTISYCNSGQYSSSLWFMMHEIAGIEGARLYDGSMHAWTNTGQMVTN